MLETLLRTYFIIEVILVLFDKKCERIIFNRHNLSFEFYIKVFLETLKDSVFVETRTRLISRFHRATKLFVRKMNT